MIVDFHTHIFPDKVAAKAIPKLSSVIHLEPSMNGTIDGLKASMEKKRSGYQHRPSDRHQPASI